MIVRRAKRKDARQILALLGQVLEVHAAIRPDIFVSGTTKYTKEQLFEIFEDETRLSFVAEEGETVLGYALCEIREPKKAENLVPFRSLYIDDLCVDESARGKGVGTRLFEYVKTEAVKLGCYEVTLIVWEGNGPAKAFYDRMGMKPKETVMELILKEEK